MDILTLNREYKNGVESEGIKTTQRNYVDFIISGQSLRNILGETERIGTFGWSDNLAYERQKINAFLGLEKPELKSGRFEFYVCRECGDIGCGAITATIEITSSTVIWKDFGYENSYEEPDLNDYKNIGPFIFDKTTYCKTIQGLKKD